MNLKALLLMVRPGNSIMAGVGIIIGSLFSGEFNLIRVLLLVIAGTSALGFGNVINDIFDVETDKIAHPERAIPSGNISITMAWGFSITLALISLGAGFAVSPTHGYATMIPLFILTLYAIKLKGTPLIGNIIVSALVAYTLIYGALGGSPILVIAPAILAFVTNMIREIVKDLVDEKGDKAAGIVTTASMDRSTVHLMLLLLILLSVIIAPLPFISPAFRVIYPVGILVVWVLELKGMRLFKAKNLVKYAANLKIQLLVGLLFVAAEGVRFVVAG